MDPFLPFPEARRQRDDQRVLPCQAKPGRRTDRILQRLCADELRLGRRPHCASRAVRLSNPCCGDRADVQSRRLPPLSRAIVHGGTELRRSNDHLGRLTAVWIAITISCCSSPTTDLNRTGRSRACRVRRQGRASWNRKASSTVQCRSRLFLR